MAGRYDHIEGCGCAACRKVEEIREEKPSYSHVDGCTCSNCRTIRDLSDARDAGAAAAEAYKEGFRRQMDR